MQYVLVLHIFDVSVMALLKVRIFDRMDNNFGWIVRMLWLAWWLGAVHDSIISEQPGVVLAVHQDDFSGFTCIGWRECGASVVARSAKGRDAESAKDAGVR